MNNDNQTPNKQPQSVQSQPQPVQPAPQAQSQPVSKPQPAQQKPVSIADQLNARNKQYISSEIPNQRGVTKDITVAAGTKNEYTLTIQYPGIAVASGIDDDVTTDNGNKVYFGRLMQDAIDNDVFVQPHITSIDFWNQHKGFAEVAGDVFRFLEDGIQGNLE